MSETQSLLRLIEDKVHTLREREEGQEYQASAGKLRNINWELTKILRGIK